ncbi:FAD-dependent monooxygenase [[Kitasatospora] papulosa]|uniref:FAD-dependent monooxygenase n=1 Tax=[Kitasatospora] papulosa TaxID=1464011 RepID=UPI002E0DCFDA|nr:FAD-dependent monooxygenase [[Kitasatospora] papulosa]WSI19008.1 FAD-dependent monooxygenase [[Kitasatospora] papulosa]
MEHVVIAGGGPTGLWLAAELRLAGTPVTVLEARHARDPHSKALTLHPRTLEILAFRGVAEPFLAEGRRIPSGHFGGLDDRMDFGTLDTPYPFTLALPQARTEELLEAHAVASGADVRRGHRVTGLTQDEDAVTVEVAGPDGPYTLRAAHLVGCDGTRSTVREAAGIAFPGTDATTWGWLGDVVLDAPPEGAVYAASGPEGGVMVVPMPGGVHRIVGGDHDSDGPDHPGELTLDALRAKVTRVAGTDFGMRDPSWLSRFGNATRQAATYREGRVLLAGDAAHMHYPAGGVGLNVGFQDATNLGWKLAATLAGTAPDGLLDSYHAERHPVGADLLLSTRAQTALMNAHSAEGQDLRTLLSRLIATVPAFSLSLAERLSGLDVAYPPPASGHPLTGHRAPNLELADGTDLFTALRPGRYVLLDFTDTPAPAPGVVARAACWPGTRPAWSTVRTALIRPDGHVARASDGPDPIRT